MPPALKSLQIQLHPHGTDTIGYRCGVGERTVNWCASPFDLASRTCNHVGMSVSNPTLDNPLDCAISQLSNLCSDRGLLTSPTDDGSVRRMLVHISNINISVLASTQDHVNASKRLNDFAITLDRMAKKSALPNDVLKDRMTAIAMNLRAASEELARSDAVPNWRTRASLH